MLGDVPINVGNNPPIPLIVLALVFAVLAIFTTPEFLIELGPGRRGLALADPLARQIARLEVAAFRGLCFIAAGVSIAASAFKGEAEDSAHLSRFYPAIWGHRHEWALDRLRYSCTSRFSASPRCCPKLSG